VVFGELGFGEVAGGNGKNTGVNRLGAMNIGGGVADDENFGWVKAGELVAGAFECGAGYFVSDFGGVAKGAKFKTMPEIVVDEFQFCAEGVEADDVIGTLTRQAEAAGLPVVVASSDKDFFQLINPNVHLLNPNDKTDTLWQAEQVRAKTGVEPAQIIDWLSLVGDTVDGIPGVRGVGPKTATKLLAEYGTAKNLYANLDAVKPDGLRARLGDAAEEVRRNQELVALKEISEWQIQLDDLRPGAVDYATLHAQYTRWNFRSLLNELESGRQGELL
jgi:hypothetical protein